MQKIIRHYLPNEDLTLAVLRRIAARCDEGQEQKEAQQSIQKQRSKLPASERIISALEHRVAGDKVELQPVEQEDAVLQEIVHLHHDLGCMLADARGQYRRAPR